MATNRDNAIATLEVGESYSEAIRIDMDCTDKKEIQTVKNSIGSPISVSVSRAKAKTSGEYAQELGTFITRSLDFMVVIVVTRTA